MQVRRYTPETHWAEPEFLSTPESAGQPQAAIDRAGSMVVMWLGQDNGTLYENWYPSDQTAWTGQSERSSGWDGLQLVMSPKDNLHVVWRQFGALRELQHQPQSGWNNGDNILNRDLRNGTNALENGPWLGVNENKDAVAIWRQPDDFGNVQLWANRRSNSSTWGTPIRIGFEDGIAWKRPAVAVDAKGNAIVVWSQSQEDKAASIWFVRYSADSNNWTTPELIGENSGSARDPRLVVDHTGHMTAVWIQGNKSLENIYAARYAPDNGWGAPVQIDENNLDDSADVFPPIDAIVDLQGVVTAAWCQFDGNDFVIYANRFE